MSNSIRIGLIGLSAAAKTSWASGGHLPYLLSERGRQKYKIVALLNSSADAARRAITEYKLGDDVKAYGSPDDLAADPNVDLVVCTTRVDKHYDTVKPSIAAGKNVYVEWPLAENVQRARELADLAKEKNIRTMVGLQGRVAPYMYKIQQVLSASAESDYHIGKVLSSEVRAASINANRDSISEGLSYFLEKKIGGNPITIGIGHMVDYVHNILGEYQTFNVQAQVQRHDWIVNLPDHNTRQATSDVPDLVFLQGSLEPHYSVDSASLLVSFRAAPVFPGTLSFVWTITGELGEMRITSTRGAFNSASVDKVEEFVIQVHNYATNKVVDVDWSWEQEWQAGLTPRGRNVGMMYDLYAEGKDRASGIADFEAAVVRHAEVDKLLW